MLSRRTFLVAAAGALSACTQTVDDPGARLTAVPAPPAPPTALALRTLYGPLPDEPFPIPAVPPGVLAPEYFRQQVVDPTGEPPGTIVVDPEAKFLHLVEPGGTAMRYGIGVGRQGFGWSGEATVAWKREWPTWTPPETMIARQPELARFSAANGGQPPGLDNALGARALYLYEGGRDTLYRIHGTPEPRSIGRSVSSGCIRLVNQDIIDLYRRVPPGTRVVVRSSRMPDELA